MRDEAHGFCNFGEILETSFLGGAGGRRKKGSLCFIFGHVQREDERQAPVKLDVVLLRDPVKEFAAGEGKNSAKFWALLHLSGSHPAGPHPFCVCASYSSDLLARQRSVPHGRYLMHFPGGTKHRCLGSGCQRAALGAFVSLGVGAIWSVLGRPSTCGLLPIGCMTTIHNRSVTQLTACAIFFFWTWLSYAHLFAPQQGALFSRRSATDTVRQAFQNF